MFATGTRGPMGCRIRGACPQVALTVPESCSSGGREWGARGHFVAHLSFPGALSRLSISAQPLRPVRRWMGDIGCPCMSATHGVLAQSLGVTVVGDDHDRDWYRLDPAWAFSCLSAKIEWSRGCLSSPSSPRCSDMSDGSTFADRSRRWLGGDMMSARRHPRLNVKAMVE